MKKIFLSPIISVILIFSGFGSANADDVGPNPVFWLRDSKPVNCVSINNPDRTGDSYNSFYVFDYSSTIGEKLGRPWSVMKKGICYQFDSDDHYNDIYAVGLINGDERKMLENAAGNQPTDNLINNSSSGKDMIIERQHFIDYNTNHGWLYGINLGDLLPTKYALLAYESSSDAYYVNSLAEELKIPLEEAAIKAINKDNPNYGEAMRRDDYIEVARMYTTFAINIKKELANCDTRRRVEYRIDQTDGSLDNFSVIWSLADKTEVVYARANSFLGIKDKIDPLSALAYMGCQNNFSRFVKENQIEFDKFDILVGKLLEKYPDIFRTEKEADSKKELVYINYSASNSNVNDGKAPETKSGGLGNNVPGPSADKISSTILEGPTSAKKTDMIFESSNLLVKAYIFLPLAAFIGMVLFVILRKKSK